MISDMASVVVRLPQTVAAAAAVCLAAGGLSWTLAAQAADAGPYPNRPIRVVVPSTTGSPLDLVARLVGDKLGAAVGQPLIVENHPGASGNIGAEVVAKSPPDGYTLMITGSVLTLLPSTMGTRAVDPVASFAPITKLGEPPMVIIAHPSLDVSTLPELIALARRQPGKIAYATMGVGSVPHLTASVISQEAGIELLHIPYANTGRAIADVLQGEVPVYFTFLGAIDAYLRSGQLRPLAVVSSRRIRAWPDIPTVVELGYKEMTTNPWIGVLAPAGTPPEIVELLYREFARFVQQPDVRERFAQIGMEPLATSPDQFSAEIRTAVMRWPPIARGAGIRPE